MPQELWIATGNPKKRAELERLLGPLGVLVRGLSDAPVPVPEVEEDRPDFAGNAAKKAASLARALGAVAVADDSGLSVNALGGRPGVRSARYAGPDASDSDRIAKLLGELQHTPQAERGARFTCSLALCGPDGTVRAAVEEHCVGHILTAPRGEHGFGYDPVFVAADTPAVAGGATPTFAELTPSEKDLISHRGKALRALSALLSTAPELLEP